MSLLDGLGASTLDLFADTSAGPEARPSFFPSLDGAASTSACLSPGPVRSGSLDPGPVRDDDTARQTAKGPAAGGRDAEARQAERERRQAPARRRVEQGDPFAQTEKDFAARLRRRGQLTMSLFDIDGVLREHYVLTEAGLDRRMTAASKKDLGPGPWQREVVIEWEEGHAKSPTPRRETALRPWKPPLPVANRHAGHCQAGVAGGRCQAHVAEGKGYHSRYYEPHLMCARCAARIWPELEPAPPGKGYQIGSKAERQAEAEIRHRDKMAFGRAAGRDGGAKVRCARETKDRAALMFVEKTKQLELIAENLGDAGATELAAKLRNCCKWGQTISCGCKEAYFPSHCHDRLCPLCAHFEAQELADRVVAIIRERKVPIEKLSMHTLTIESVDEIEGVWSDLQFYFLRYKALCLQFFPSEFGEVVEVKNDDGTITEKVCFRGAFRCLETTWNDEHGFHAHGHAVVEHDKVDQQILSDLWFVASGFRGYVMDVRRLYGRDLKKGVHEVVKGPVHATHRVEGVVRDEVVKAVTSYLAKAVKCADGTKLVELRESMNGHRLAEAVGQWSEVDDQVKERIAAERKAERIEAPPVGETCLDCGQQIKRLFFFGAGWQRIEVLKRVGKRVVWRTERSEKPPDG